jgi:hypothetical protein
LIDMECGFAERCEFQSVGEDCGLAASPSPESIALVVLYALCSLTAVTMIGSPVSYFSALAGRESGHRLDLSEALFRTQCAALLLASLSGWRDLQPDVLTMSVFCVGGRLRADTPGSPRKLWPCPCAGQLRSASTSMSGWTRRLRAVLRGSLLTKSKSGSCWWRPTTVACNASTSWCERCLAVGGVQLLGAVGSLQTKNEQGGEGDRRTTFPCGV